MKKFRCAIYTRKSTEDGLDQEFNSLDAQREACEAYIVSQKSQGWSLKKTQYNDGGISGGTMDRPGLQALLEDVRAGKVDIIVVYKVDRLTRSLADFAKIVEILDDKGASFVSVTQAFNTTTSMGRLTLNVLLSFAQFEREVTAERIRDKIAASRKKGLWMGGPVPLGYDVKDKKLHINKSEAETVRCIFSLYLELDNVRELQDECHRRGYQTKRQSFSTGRKTGGCIFTRGRLYHLLKNPLYIGKVRHKEETYEGQHEGIVDPEIWNRVQDKLAGRNQRVGRCARNGSKPYLLGKIVDEEGNRLTTNHAVKGGKRYRYYISRYFNQVKVNGRKGWRISAPEIEGIVVKQIRDLIGDSSRLMDLLLRPDMEPSSLKDIQSVRNNIDIDALFDLVKKVTLCSKSIAIELGLPALMVAIGLPSNCDSNEKRTLKLQSPISLRRRGVETKIVIGEFRQVSPNDNASLKQMLLKAARWADELKSGTVSSIAEISAQEEMDPGDVSRYLPLAFLAPDISEAILTDTAPIDLTIHKIKRLNQIPMAWDDQRKVLGFAA